jgi:hypothetical protein
VIRVIILSEVIDCFLELASILYKKGYFGFEEDAIRYVRELFEEIRDELPRTHRKSAPEYFEKRGKGMFYAVFKRNKNTSWYVFFNIYHTKEETLYFVRYVNNNHMIAQYM